MLQETIYNAPEQTEFNAFGVTDGNFNKISYKKNSLLMVKNQQINHIMKKY